MAQYELNLRDYWRIVRKRKNIVIFTTLMLGVFSFFFASMQKPIPLFTATASVKIEETQSITGVMVETVTFSKADKLETEAAIIASYLIAEKAGRSLGLIPKDLPSEQVRQAPEHLGMILNIKSKIKTQQEGFTNIININVTDSNPKFAQKLANTIAQVYKEEHTTAQNKRTIESRKFIEEQLNKITTKLSESEDRVRSFRESNKLVSVETQGSSVLGNINQAKVEVEKLKRVIGEIGEVLKQLRAQQAVEQKTFEGLFAEGASPVFASLNSQLITLKLKRDTLLLDFTPQHPQVLETDTEISETTKRMTGELEAQEQTLKKRSAGVEADLAKLEEEYKMLPEKGLTLERLTRNVMANFEIYKLLEGKYQEALIKEAEKIEEVTIVRPALEPREPINPPKTGAVAFIGAVMGMIFGLVIAFVFETLDTSIGTIEDVESYLQVSVLGIIPHISIDDIKDMLLDKMGDQEDDELLERNARLVSHFAPKSTLAESYRALRTNIQFASLEKNVKTIVLTSSQPQEGKSTTAANLALTMAQAGSKTLLIDADLRKPVIAKVFGLDREPGLTDILLGNNHWKETIKTVTDIMMGRLGMEDIMLTPGIDKLHIITNGSIPPNPSELLGSKKVNDFLEDVKKEYDVILFDTAPILPATDAAILGSKVDGVVIVYEVGKVSRGALKRAKVQMDNVKATVLGVVLNGMKAETSPDFADYRYYSYYSYGKEDEEVISWWQKMLVGPLKPFKKMSKKVKKRRRTKEEAIAKEKAEEEEKKEVKKEKRAKTGIIKFLVLILAAGLLLFGLWWQEKKGIASPRPGQSHYILSKINSMVFSR